MKPRYHPPNPAARLAELKKEQAKALARARCKGCGCTPDKPCTIVDDAGDAISICVPAQDMKELGGKTCSGCLTPTRRRPWVDPRQRSMFVPNGEGDTNHDDTR